MHPRKIGFLASLASIVVMCSPTVAAKADDTVKVGVFQSISDAGIYIAADKGYFTEQGLKVEVQNIDSSATVTTALASGDIDVSGGSPAASIYNAVRQGVPIRIVADKGSTLPGHGYFAFMVRKALADQIKTPADLRDRTLAATGYFAGASNEVTIHRLLEPAGVKESQVKIVAMSFPDVVAGLGTGAIDVATLIEPLVTVAVDKGFAVVWKRADEIYPSQQYAALIYGPSITKRPDVATRFMAAYLKGVRFYNDALTGKIPRSELIAILTKNTTVKNAELYDRMKLPGLDPNGTLNVAGMAEDMKFFVAEGRMKEPIDINKIVDTTYTEAAVKKLGEYK
jgi:ABC-type nitrate/sulfonate/bicarbonate transport system substrate-binding protein